MYSHWSDFQSFRIVSTASIWRWWKTSVSKLVTFQRIHSYVKSLACSAYKQMKNLLTSGKFNKVVLVVGNCHHIPTQTHTRTGKNYDEKWENNAFLPNDYGQCGESRFDCFILNAYLSFCFMKRNIKHTQLPHTSKKKYVVEIL